MSDHNFEPALVKPIAVPFSEDNEVALIGSVLINPAIFPQLSHVDPEDFYVERNQWVWEAFERLYAAGNPIDTVTTLTEMEKFTDIDDFGGIARMTHYLSNTPSSLHATSYADIVIDMAERREKLAIANELAVAAYDLTTPMSVSSATLLDRLSRGRESGKDYSTAALHQEFMTYVDLDMKGTPTFIEALDSIMGNIPFGALTLLAARTSAGKTALATQIARSNAANKLKTIYFSTEMERTFLWERFACGQIGIDVTRLRAGTLSKAEIEAVKKTSEKLMNAYGDNLIIIDDVWSVEEMHQIAASISDSVLIVVDHLDEIEWHGKDDQESTWRGKAVKFLRKYVARRLGKALIVVHQLNRAVEQRQDKRPLLSDLRWDGSLEQISDIVMLIHREDYHENKAGIIISPTEIILAKHRYGKRLDSAYVDYNLREQFFDSCSFPG